MKQKMFWAVAIIGLWALTFGQMIHLVHSLCARLPASHNTAEGLGFSLLAVFAVVQIATLCLGINRAARRFSIAWMHIFGRLCVVALGIYAAGVDYRLWGPVAVIMGLLMFLGGVIPVAMLASSVKGEWGTLAIIFGAILFTVLVGAIKVLWRRDAMAEDYLGVVKEDRFRNAKNISPAP